MPQKFANQNPKVVAANERKAAVKSQKDAKQQAEKDAQTAQEWSVGSKDASRKQAEEQKRLEKLAKKAEKEAMLAAEEKEIAAKKPVLRGSDKSAGKKMSKTDSFASDSGLSIERFSASNLDDALELLTLATSEAQPKSSDKIERHPERRMKSAYAIFEEKEMPLLKAENPTLRLTQLKQLLQKKWKKSPENPMNQQSIAFDTKRDEEVKILAEHRDQALDKFRSH